MEFVVILNTQNLEIAVWETYRRTKAKIAVKCDVCVVNGFCLHVICPIFANIVTSVYRDRFIYLSSPPISPVIITVFCGEMQYLEKIKIPDND